MKVARPILRQSTFRLKHNNFFLNQERENPQFPNFAECSLFKQHWDVPPLPSPFRCYGPRTGLPRAISFIKHVSESISHNYKIINDRKIFFIGHYYQRVLTFQVTKY